MPQVFVSSPGTSFLRSTRLLLLALTMSLLMSLASLAQTGSSGQVAGNVTDQNGAIVPDATVTVTNLATGAKRTCTVAWSPAGITSGTPSSTSTRAAPLRWASLLGEWPTDCSLEAFERHLEEDGRLSGRLASISPWWFLAGREHLAELRRERTAYSQVLWPQARRYGHLIAALPFVRLVSITGPAGIGKSRLAWEFEKYVDGLVESIFWHRGRSPSYGEGIAFWA